MYLAAGLHAAVRAKCRLAAGSLLLIKTCQMHRFRIGTSHKSRPNFNHRSNRGKNHVAR